ncbi:MAG: cation-translocating P-type ATPase [Candidatus Thiodiazotropha sp. (ex Monitilora ramsayi)]|nr:cation-translocating P-type ATPase [Candidatus Thiodiazotropha sp. (ex Monitilora ramsayi)]
MNSDSCSSIQCSHCQLPVGKGEFFREVEGEIHRFCCYGCCLAYQVHRGAREEPEAAWLLIRLGVGAFLAMNIMLFSLLLYSGSLGVADGYLIQGVHVLLWILATPVLLILGGPFIYNACRQALHGRVTADALVSIGALAAYGYSALQVIAAGEVVYFDTATMVLVLFTLGRYIEAMGRVRTARSLAPMLEAERATATVVAGGQDHEQFVTRVRPGMVVRVRPGERVPVDGMVTEGRSACNEAVLTGQSEEKLKVPGSAVHAGSINANGQLLIRASVPGADTQWMRMSRQIREMLGHQSLAGALVDRIAALFVPAVLLLAIGTVYYWSGYTAFEQAMMAGVAVLVVACPCALGLAAPLATAIGLGRAAQHGILIRGGRILERLGQIRAVAFDKTGTLTTGNLEVVGATAIDGNQQGLLERSAGLAHGSEHPIARAIQHYVHDRGVIPTPGIELEAHPGQGMTGVLDGALTAMGSENYMVGLGCSIPALLVEKVAANKCGCTLVYVGWDHQVRGLLELSDAPKAGARTMIQALHLAGIETCLLSGDNEPAVTRTAHLLGIQEWRAGLLPVDKVAALKVWERRHGSVAMVGDGLNDGPVLANASVGIAVGEASDLARETADITLPKAALGQLPGLIQLAHRVRKVVLTNAGWALGYNLVALGLAAQGLLLPIIAAALMAGSSLMVVANSLRAGRESATPVSDNDAFYLQSH